MIPPPTPLLQSIRDPPNSLIHAKKSLVGGISDERKLRNFLAGADQKKKGESRLMRKQKILVTNSMKYQ